MIRPARGAARTLAILALAVRLLGNVALGPCPARAQSEPVEPPPEASEGADYTLESADTLESGTFELGIGAAGRDGGAVTSRRRVRVSQGDLSAEAREGAGDDLAGGSVRSGWLDAGRLGLGWARGLALGGTDEPWRFGAEGGRLAVSRRRRADGVRIRPPRAAGAELFAARAGKRVVGGARVRARRLALGVVVVQQGPPVASAALESRSSSTELAMDRSGRWRAESAIARPLGACSLRVRARGGLSAFAAPVDADRQGPARLLSVTCGGYQGGTHSRALAALWSYGPGRSGARGALEVERPMAHHQRLTAGFEEQRGVRRESASAGDAARQGAWAAWRGATRSLRLELRSEVWGRGPWARRAMRRVDLAAVEVSGPLGTGLRVSHGTYRVGAGGSLYLAEDESDRVVLRALTGAGERTRVEVKAPLADGRVRATMNVTAAAGRAPRMQWTVDWTRRLRARRPR